MRSIQRYLSTRILWGSASVLVGGTVILALVLHALDVREFDAALEDKAQELASLMDREGRFIEIGLAHDVWPEFQAGEDPEYFQFRLLDGSVMMRSKSLQGRDLPFLPKAVGPPAHMNLRLPNGRRGRFVQIIFSPRVEEDEEGDEAEEPDGDYFRIPDTMQPESVLVVLGLVRSRESTDILLLKVYAILAGMDLLLVTLIAGLIRRVLRKGFLTVEEMNAQIGELEPTRLHKGLNLPETPVELDSVVSALNRLLEKLHDAFQWERRFTSDVTHELRTPVSEFRAACEVGAKWSDDPALVRKRFDNLRESAVNMERILVGLLDLTRLDQGAVRIESTVTAIAALVDSSWGRVCNDNVDSVHRLENHIDRSLHLKTDPVKLEQIIVNLLSNAVRYSPPGSSVSCASEHASDGKWELRFSNPTDALEQEDLRHMFERFWRKDAARTGGGHSGLGLSIVQVLAEALGIEVIADLTADRVFTVTLRFPDQAAV